jgi:CHASE2 domain-containing sensor protein
MMDGRFMTCHWTAMAERGVGFMGAALGFLFLAFKSAKTRLGLACAVLLSGVLALSIPHILIGGCGMESMACRRTAFPALTVLSGLSIFASTIEIFYLYKQNGD